MLGQCVSQGSVRVPTSRLKAILELPKPHNKKSCRSFLGVLNYIRKHIRNFAEMAKPLTELTESTREGFDWGQKHDDAYDLIMKFENWRIFKRAQAETISTAIFSEM